MHRPATSDRPRPAAPRRGARASRPAGHRRAAPGLPRPRHRQARSSTSGTCSGGACGCDEPRASISVVIPVYNEGEEIVPFLDRLFEAVTAPLRGARRVRHAGRHARSRTSRSTPSDEPRLVPTLNTYGRGPARGDPLRRRPRRRRRHRRDHGRRQRRPPADRPPRPPRRAGRRGRRRVAVHAGRPAGRRARPEVADVAGRRPVAATGSPGSAPTTPPTRSRPTRREFVERSASSPTPASRSASSWSPRPAGCRLPVAEVPTDLARPQRRRSRTSSSPSGCPGTCAGTATPSARSSRCQIRRER